MRRINLDDDFDDDYEDFDDAVDDDYDDFDDDYRANPDSALASLMKLASEAMAASGMYGSTVDVDFSPSEAKVKEWAALSNAEQLAPGVWFARYYAVFRYSKALWRKQTPAQRQAKIRTAFLSVAKLYLNEEQREKASKPPKASSKPTKASKPPKASTKESGSKAPGPAWAKAWATGESKDFYWFFRWKPSQGQPARWPTRHWRRDQHSIFAKTREEALEKATMIGKPLVLWVTKDGRASDYEITKSLGQMVKGQGKRVVTERLVPDPDSIQLDLDGRLAAAYRSSDAFWEP